MRYAGIVTRALALVVDAAVANVIALVVTAAVALLGSLFDSNLNFDLLGGLLAGFGWIIWVALYFSVFWTVTGQTPGDRLLRDPGGQRSWRHDQLAERAPALRRAPALCAAGVSRVPAGAVRPAPTRPS